MNGLLLGSKRARRAAKAARRALFAREAKGKARKGKMGPFLLVHFAMTGNRKRQLHKARLARRRNAVPPIGPLVRFKAVFAFPMRFAEQRNNGRQAACNYAQSVWQPSKSIGRFLLRAKKQAAAGALPGARRRAGGPRSYACCRARWTAFPKSRSCFCRRSRLRAARGRRAKRTRYPR